MIRVPAEPIGRLSEAWRHCVGTGRLELALRRDYQDSLRLLQDEIGFRYIRGHGLFCDGMAVYRPYEWPEGVRRVRHSFTYVDQVIDAYLDLGIRPFLELGFMPEELASGGQTVFWWKGNVTPPRDHAAWAALVRATGTHLVDRYGLDEVRTWPIEVWNEPNLPDFWQNADRRQLAVLHEASEPGRRYQRLPVTDHGRVDLDLTLTRHEVTLVEVSAVRDEASEWADEGRLLGRAAR